MVCKKGPAKRGAFCFSGRRDVAIQPGGMPEAEIRGNHDMAGNVGGRRPGAGRPKGARNKVTKEQKATVAEIAMAYTDRAIRVLVEIMEDSAQTGSARAVAANSILDRAHGKPQVVDQTQQDDDAAPVSWNVRPPVGDVRVTRH